MFDVTKCPPGYENVPGQGKILADGTWWTYKREKVEPGYTCVTPYWDRKVVNGKVWACDRRTKCIDTAIFDGKPFARWEELPASEYKPCILYINNSLRYEE